MHRNSGRPALLAARHAAVCFAVATSYAVLSRPIVEAHKPITSKYTYAEHVFPIVRDRCGACHFPGGPAPMSLLSYKDAVPWAESIREQLTTEAMPPWFVEATGSVMKGGHSLLNRELDVLVTWASGGTPEGDPSKIPPATPPSTDWATGKPDHVFDLPEVALAPGTIEQTKEFSVATGFTRDTWVRGADALPSERSMVRSVTVTVDGGPLLAAWVPGEAMAPVPSGTAFKVPANAVLKVAVHYRKNWQDEQVAKADRTRIGLYATDEPISGTGITTLRVTETITLTAPVRILAIRPLLNQPLDAISVEATLPSGRKVSLLNLRAARPGWARRYWLGEPVELPAGTSVTVHVSGDNPAVDLLTVGP
ncbi:MAG: hypothetical protein ABL971_13555 [Vicinamibacterales bacterium]